MPQPGTLVHDPRDDSPTPRPGSQSPASPREAENASNISPANGSAGRHTKSARRRAGYPERLDARRSRGAVVGAHRVDQGDGAARGTESDREAHGEGDRNVSDPEDTSVMRAEAVSDEDVGTRYPRRGSRVAISSRNRDR